MKRCVLFSIFWLFLSAALLAQQNAGQGIQVKGQVVDSLTNETVPFATLNIAPASDPANPVTRLACDLDGFFTATLRSAGDYLFTFQSIGKNTLVRPVNIPADQPVIELGTVRMTDLDNELGEVTVVAQRPLVVMAIDKITYNLEEDPEAKTNTTLDILRKVPMVTVDGEDRIQLKGSDNYRIYLNGKPTNMLSNNNASNVLRSMPASSVKNIEVITDPGAKYDAEGVGGIINIITVRANVLQGYTANLNASAGSMGGYQMGGNITTKIGSLGLTANYNHNHNVRPWSGSETVREQYGAFASTLEQQGRSKTGGNYDYGSLEATYELDTMNLIRVGASYYGSKYQNLQEMHAVMTPHTENMTHYSYDRYADYRNNYGGLEVNTDFQHSTKKKDELLTFSYRFSNEPDDYETYTYLKNEVNYYNTGMYPRKSKNDSYTHEHTGQIDYTTPTLKDQTLEAGVKYILRQNHSDTNEQILDEASGSWNPYVQPTDIFDHVQHIYAGYFAYAIKYKSFSYKAGLRGEGTSLNVRFKKEASMDFSTDYFDAVPNATIAYMINMASQLRFGYNMRISRPPIWYLNPYVNNTDPQNISYGNPHLESQRGHNVNANYTMFTSKININASLSYNFTNNAIERYTFINQTSGIRETTYENIGKSRNTTLYLYGRWSPVSLFNISLNAGLYHYSTESPSRNLSSAGFGGMTYANIQFNLPKDFSVNAYGQYYRSPPRLQSKTQPYFIDGYAINKMFLNKKLTVSLTVQSPFNKYIKMETTTTDRDFRNYDLTRYPYQEVRLRVTYRFGTLKENIKRVSRSISNDDVSSRSE